MFRNWGRGIRAMPAETVQLIPDGRSTAIPAGSETRLFQLDGARGLAALAVVIAHFNPLPAVVAPGSALAALLWPIHTFAMGNLAVVFFFSLSSFLLTYLARREFEAAGTFSIRSFLVRRTLRIWPLYFFVVALTYALHWQYSVLPPQFGASHTSFAWISSHVPLYVLFGGNWSMAFNFVEGYRDGSPAVFRILWSICVEEQFYLVYPFVIWAILRQPKLRPIIIVLLSILPWVFRLWFCSLAISNPHMKSTGGLYYSTLTYVDVFLLGGLAGWLAGGPAGTWHRLGKRTWVGPLLVALACVTGALWSKHLWYPYSPMSLAGYPLAGAIFAAFLFWLACQSSHPLSRVLSSRPLRWLGSISYRVYVWHVWSNALLAWGFASTPSGSWIAASAWVRLMASIFGALALATLSRILIENPFLRIKAKFRCSGATTGGLARARSS